MRKGGCTIKPLYKRDNLLEYPLINKDQRFYSLYVTAGEKCKTIGNQDGSFHDFGHHLKNEMGGIWVHPIKIADGFYLEINGQYYSAVEYETLPYGNIFRYGEIDGVKIRRFQFSPDEAKGIYVQYTFTNKENDTKSFKLRFITRFDILPVWFSEHAGIFDNEDFAQYDDLNQVVIAKDEGHEWYGVLGCDLPISREQVHITKEHIEPYASYGRGVSAAISLSILLEPYQSKDVTFIIAGSAYGKEDAIREFMMLRDNKKQYYTNKVERYHQIRNSTRLQTSDPYFDQVFEWVKYNTDWLIADCEKYGRGLTAGIPEYPWWFGCDNSYSLQGVLALGQFELARQTLMLLKEYSEKHNGNGRIVHEVTTNGVIANPGNTQETAHYIAAVYHYWRWTGDIDAVRELYDYCRKGIDWLLKEMDDDEDLLPSGYGIIEIEGLNVELIDTAVYTCQALYCMYEMSKALNEENQTYLEMAHKLHKIINTRLWDEKQGLYVDAVATPAQMLERIDILLHHEHHSTEISPEYRKYLENMKAKLSAMPQDEEQPFIVNKNWVINTPIETKLADYDKAITALNNMRKEGFIGEYGVYLSGFMRKHMMTISTGVQAVAEGRYYRCDESLDLLKRICRTFGMVLPGSISEMSPDYGCFVQAWTVYAMVVPVVECFAGLRPEAFANRLIINPCIPSEWDKMELTHVRVGDGYIDFSFERRENREVYVISSTGDLDIQFIPSKPGKVFVNGVPVVGQIHLGIGTSIVEIISLVEESSQEIL